MIITGDIYDSLEEKNNTYHNLNEPAIEVNPLTNEYNINVKKEKLDLNYVLTITLMTLCGLLIILLIVLVILIIVLQKKTKRQNRRDEPLESYDDIQINLPQEEIMPEQLDEYHSNNTKTQNTRFRFTSKSLIDVNSHYIAPHISDKSI